MKSNKISDILNLYYITDFYVTRILEIIIWSKLLYGNLSRYAEIHVIEKMVDNTGWTLFSFEKVGSKKDKSTISALLFNDTL